MSHSEQRALSILFTTGRDALSGVEFYKACAGLANNGRTHEREYELNPSEQLLLNARRLLSQGRLVEAAVMLESLNEALLTHLYAGDRHFLLALVHHRQGDIQLAARDLDRAIVSFRMAGDTHRELRSAVNRLICFSDCDSCTVGALIVLEQRALREGYYDIAGVIQRTRALELLRTCHLTEALAAGREAVRSYSFDGCPEDRLITIALVAIIEVLIGNLSAAQELRSSIFPVEPRVQVYLNCYEQIVAGRLPTVPKGHALDAIPWKKMALKPMSVPGKIIAALKSRPLSRDQLIESVWGSTADHPSYRNRLYTAINAIRKANHFDIYFDGESYRLR